MAAILNATPGDFCVLIALVCSSWTAVNAGTSKRSVTNARGDESVQSVRRGNCMLARTLCWFSYDWLCIYLGHNVAVS
jgi:hypothetical protein